MPAPKPASRNRLDLDKYSTLRLDRVLPYLQRQHPAMPMTRALACRIALFELIDKVEAEHGLDPIDLPIVDRA